MCSITDEVVIDPSSERVGYRSSPSLRPSTEAMMLAFVLGDVEAVACVEAWQFQHPVRVVPADDPLWQVEGTVLYGR